MSVAGLIRAYSRQYGIDPGAALSVARVEGGLGRGAVGDQGTSFGPFQLHVGGALPAGRGAAWANSPAGIEYAIRRMSQAGARGLTGRAAVASIVRNFERPADIPGEIQRALGLYGSGGGTVPTGRRSPPGGNAARPGGDSRAQAVAMLQNFAATGNVGGTPGQQNPFAALMNLAQTQGKPGGQAAAPNVPGSPRIAKALNFAQSAIGTPYVWGGESPKGYDCSGLVQAAFARAGINLPRTTYGQIKADGRWAGASFGPAT